MTSHKTFYRNALWQYLLQIIKYILPLLTLPYLTRVLEPEGYAVYAYVVSFMTFVQTFVDFGFNLSGTKEVASTSDRAELGLVVGTISQARVLLCLVTGVACIVICYFIPIMRANATYATLAFIAVCGRALTPDFLFQGKERMAPITLRYLFSKSISTVLTFMLVHSVADLLWVPILDIISSVLALAWSFVAARQLFDIKIVWGSFDRVLKELAYSGYYCLSNMASAGLSGVATLMIGSSIPDPVQISYWSITMTAIGAVQSLYSPIVNSLYPHMVVGGDYGFARKLALLSIPFVFGGTAAFIFLAKPIILIIGGPEYLSAASVLRITSPVLFFSFYGMLLGWPVLGAIGRVKELTRTTLIASLLNFLLMLIVSICGHATIYLFAMIRTFVEALMAVMRINECVKASKEF